VKFFRLAPECWLGNEGFLRDLVRGANPGRSPLLQQPPRPSGVQVFSDWRAESLPGHPLFGGGQTPRGALGTGFFLIPGNLGGLPGPRGTGFFFGNWQGKKRGGGEARRTGGGRGKERNGARVFNFGPGNGPGTGGSPPRARAWGAPGGGPSRSWGLGDGGSRARGSGQNGTRPLFLTTGTGWSSAPYFLSFLRCCGRDTSGGPNGESRGFG